MNIQIFIVSLLLIISNTTFAITSRSIATLPARTTTRVITTTTRTIARAIYTTSNTGKYKNYNFLILNYF